MQKKMPRPNFAVDEWAIRLFPKQKGLAGFQNLQGLKSYQK